MDIVLYCIVLHCIVLYCSGLLDTTGDDMMSDPTCDHPREKRNRTSALYMYV